MSKNWKTTKTSNSPRLIPMQKDLKYLIKNKLNGVKIEDDVVVLSDWPEALYQDSHNPKNKPLIGFYSTDSNYSFSLNWMEQFENELRAVLWKQDMNPMMKGMIKKMKFHLADPVADIEVMVHTGSYRTLLAYCCDSSCGSLEITIGHSHIWVQCPVISPSIVSAMMQKHSYCCLALWGPWLPGLSCLMAEASRWLRQCPFPNKSLYRTFR
ncbi:uncharacterized protein RHO17_001254 [Thomomys bottae]